jgi:hypothetical protein
MNSRLYKEDRDYQEFKINKLEQQLKAQAEIIEVLKDLLREACDYIGNAGDKTVPLYAAQEFNDFLNKPELKAMLGG